ncbi:unnamed protein product, partial [Didymodactylos carnosus]
IIKSRSQNPIQDESNDSQSICINPQLISNESRQRKSYLSYVQKQGTSHNSTNLNKILRRSNTMLRRDSNAVVLSHSSINLGRGQHVMNQFQPTRIIANRNGRQYIEDMNERIEKRFVRCTNDFGEKKYFEVIDIIPIKTVQRYNQSNGQNNLTPLRSSQYGGQIPMINFRRPMPTTQLMDFVDLEDPEQVHAEYHRYLSADRDHNMNELPSVQKSLPFRNHSPSINAGNVTSHISGPNNSYSNRRTPSITSSSSDSKIFHPGRIPSSSPITTQIKNNPAFSDGSESSILSHESDVTPTNQLNKGQKKSTTKVTSPISRSTDDNFKLFPEKQEQNRQKGLYTGKKKNVYESGNRGTTVHKSTYTPHIRPVKPLTNAVGGNQYSLNEKRNSRTSMSSIGYS